MSRTPRAPLSSRRSLLKGLGLASAAIAAQPLASAGSRALAAGGSARTASRGVVRVGLLLPYSDLHPAPSTSFLTGLRRYLDDNGQILGGRRVELCVEEVGSGVSRTIRATERLLETERVDLVIGLVGSGALHYIEPMLAAARTPLIAVGAGERAGDAPASAYVVHNTLDYGRSSRAAGTWAAETHGRRGVIMTSLYESGFDAPRGFRVGFEEAGGEIADLIVADAHHHTSTDLAAALDAVAALKPDVLFAAYARDAAVDFVRAFGDSRCAGRIPVVGSSFLTSDETLGSLGSAAVDMASASTWTHTLDTPENRAFVDAFRRATGGRPDAFSMLGYETAMLLEKGMEKGRNLKREELAAALAGAAFTGPRGAMSVDAATGCLTSPLYLHTIRRGMGSLSNDVVGRLDAAAPAMTAARSGLLTPYLVV